MSTLRLGTLELSRALLHAGNPLPPLARVGDAHADVDATAADAEMKRNLAYGRPRSLLPYTMLDGYGRDRQPCTVDTVVLENEQLRATFLPWLGGRLWSLVHRPTDRELLYRNRVVQPANFALRDAWCSGGVEWNIATTGHSPLTSEPMHAARINLGDGTPALRLYGWERMRGVAFHVDAWLPDSSPVLLVRVGIVNPGAEETPMYWWSNIAVPEVSGVRVLAPAEQAYHFSYDKRLRLVDVPRPSGTSGIAGADITYPARAPQPGDYFFECRQASRPWIAAVDADGHGLAQVSTAALRGRKLFVWGRAAGGRHWQDFLSGGHSDQEYCEIQAGLARTQLEHLPMPAGARWSWVEAYGPLALDPAVAHGDWRAARRAVEEALTWLGSCDRIDRVLADAEDWADQEPDDTLFLGSGWGALERHRRAATDEPELGLTGMPFPDESLTTAQRPWLELLRTGRVPEVPPELPPASYVAGPDWLNLLEAAPDGWAAWLHRGVARWAAGDERGARDAWRHSLEHRDNAWAARNLAAALSLAGAANEASRNYLHAHRLRPGPGPLAVETVGALLDAGRPRTALETLDSLDMPQGSANGHSGDSGAVSMLRLLEVRAALAVGEIGRAERILKSGLEIPNLREGEALLHQLWRDYCAARRAAGTPLADESLPYAYDFRMNTSD